MTLACRFSCRIATVALSVCLASAAVAETYPDKPIRAFIPFGAGSATDVVPRALFDALGAELGQTAGDGFADSFARPGDDRHLAGHVETRFDRFGHGQKSPRWLRQKRRLISNPAKAG